MFHKGCGLLSSFNKLDGAQCGLLWRALKYKSLWAASLCPLPSRLLLLTRHAKEGHNEESGVAEHGCLTKKREESCAIVREEYVYRLVVSVSLVPFWRLACRAVCVKTQALCRRGL
jgi:hypothetical protein